MVNTYFKSLNGNFQLTFSHISTKFVSSKRPQVLGNSKLRPRMISSRADTAKEREKKKRGNSDTEMFMTDKWKN